MERIKSPLPQSRTPKILFVFKKHFLNRFWVIVVFTILFIIAGAILRFSEILEYAFSFIQNEFLSHKSAWGIIIAAIIVIVLLFLLRYFIRKVKEKTPLKSERFFFEERPLDPEKGEIDTLGIQHIVNEITGSIRGLPVANPIFIGITGAWGSGKTSLMKLISYELKNDSNIIPVWFVPWHYQDDNAMIEGMLNMIHTAIKGKTGDSPQSNIKNLTKAIKFHISYGPLGVEWQKKGAGLTKEKDKIGEWLTKNNYRLMVFLDDLDRLDEKEIKLILKMVREFLNFHSTVMILGYDKFKLQKKLGIDTDKFFDIEIPLNIEKEMLWRWFENQAVNYESLQYLLEELKGKPDIQTDFKEAFREISTLREVKQFINELLLAWPVVKGEVFFPQFAIVCIMRRKLPELYQVLAEGKYSLLTERKKGNLGQEWGDMINGLVEDLVTDSLAHYDMTKASKITFFLNALGNISFEISPNKLKLLVVAKESFGDFFHKHLSRSLEAGEHGFWKSEHPERYFLWRPPAYSYPASQIQQLLKDLSKEIPKEKIKNLLKGEIKISTQNGKIISFCNQLKDELLSSRSNKKIDLIKLPFYEEMIEQIDSSEDWGDIKFFSDLVHGIAVSYGYPESCQRFLEAIPKIKNPFKTILFITEPFLVPTENRTPGMPLKACPKLKEAFQKQCKKVFLEEKTNICDLVLADDVIGRIVYLFQNWEDEDNIVRYLKELKKQNQNCADGIKAELAKFAKNTLLNKIATQI